MRRIREFDDSIYLSKSAEYGNAAGSIRASAAGAPAPMGHPDFAHLGIGESGSRDAAVMFLDMRRFTARSFWDPPEQVLRVNTAVVTELAAAVQRHGGYVLGLRGDGVFACFDGSSALGARAAAGFAVVAGAFALDAVRNALNGLLAASGIDPVQVRVGLDYGRLDFVRIGTPAGSEVNVLGFAANFASKCEKHALSWEMVAGEGLAHNLPQQHVTHHDKSPAEYEHLGERRVYRFYDVSWMSYLEHVPGVADALGGRPASAVNVR